MVEQYSLVMFQEFLRSEESVKTYTWTVKQFIKYFHLKDYDSIVEIEKKELQKMIETWVIHLKKTISPNSISTYANHVKTFLEANDIDLNWRRIKRFYPAKVKRSGSSAYTTEDVKEMLDATTLLKNKAIIHFLASTGVRIGSIPELKIKHLRDMPLNCKMVTIYEDSTEEYQTFLTPESSMALDQSFEQRRKLGEILNEESPLFRTRYLLKSEKIKPMSKESLQSVLGRAIRKTTIRGQKKNGRYAEQLAHGFRKRFNTILKLDKDVNDNVIEKMMGHKRGLDGTYLVLSPEQMFDEFKHGITDLTISDEARDKITIQALQEEKSELEQVNEKLKEVQKEKDELGKKYRESLTKPIDDNMLNKKIEEILKKHNIE